MKKTITIFCLLWCFYGLGQQLKVQEIATGLNKVVDIASTGYDNRLFVAENAGLIKTINSNTVFLDLRNKIGAAYSGIQGLVFHPDYKNNGLFYVKYYRNNDKAIVISAFKVSANPDVADTNSERVLFEFPNYSNGHLGGDLAFDNEGYLYTTFGDGDAGPRGAKGDAYAYSQNPAYIYGKLIRIHVVSAKYEILASGLRNAWRIAFDEANGDFWTGDVGQDRYEEINYVPAGALNGKNFGWGCYEGNSKHIDLNCLPNVQYTDPLIEYAGFDLNGGKAVSVTGGLVYRSDAYPSLKGHYIYADYISGEFWLAKQKNGALESNVSQGVLVKNPVTFGKGTDGRLYVASYSEGKIYEVIPITPKITRGAYLQMPTENSIVIRWNTDIAHQGTVEVGEWGKEVSKIFTESSATTDHQIKIEGLQANTKYFYRILGNGQTLQAEADNYFSTPPPIGSTQALRIWAMGDFGDGSYRQNQISVRDAYAQWHKQHATDVWLWLGDNAYCCGTESEYDQHVFQIYPQLLKNIPFWAATGNHEYYADANLKYTRQIDLLKFTTTPTKAELGGIGSNERLYYSFNQNNVHFVVLDSYGLENGLPLSDKNSPQYKWLEKDLAANKQTWTIVSFHHPPYTRRSHDSDAEVELVNIRQALVPLFDTYKVDLVLNGHSHIYERSYLIKGHTGYSSSFNLQQHAVQNTNARYDGTANSCPIINKNEGTIYAVVGSAGNVELNSIASLTGSHPSSAYSNISIGGSLVIDVGANQLSAQWLAADGKVYDQFTVLKNVNKTHNISLEYGAKTTLNASWKGQYEWSDGTKNKQSIEVQPLTSTIYTVKDNYGCLLDKFAVEVKPQPQISTQNITSNPICAGKEVSVGFSVINADISLFTYQVQLSEIGGSFTNPTTLKSTSSSPVMIQIPANLEAGTYKLRVISTDAGTLWSYQSSGSFSVSVSPSISLAGGTTIPYDSTTLLRATLSGTVPLKVTLSDGQGISTSNTNATFKVKPPVGSTVFSAMVENVCGVASSNNITVLVLPALASEEFDNGTWDIAPNPVSEVLVLSRKTQSLENVQIQLFDLGGRLMKELNTNQNQAEINLQNLSNGLYIIAVRGENNQILNKKRILKQ